MWDFRYIGKGRAITRARNGFHYVYDVDDLSVGLHMLIDGCHEPHVSYALSFVVRPGDVVVDVGANIGYHSVEMASAVGPMGRVHCFDPNPQILPLLKRNVWINGFASRCSIHSVAVLDCLADASIMHIYENNYGGATVNHVANGNIVVDDISVVTTSIDVALAGSHIDVLKVDAEGSDGRVLRGAMDTLREARAVIFEYESAFGDTFLRDAFQDLLVMGFAAHVITSPSGVPIMFRCDLSEFDHCDILMLRQ